MHLTARKEQFSRAYVQAIAAAAGCSWSEPSVDDDSVDLTLSMSGAFSTFRSPKLDIQLKCHADVLPTSDFSFPLKLKNYDDLRDDTVLVPRILVILIVPMNLTDWLVHAEPEMTVRRCAYWVSLRGASETSNTTTVSVPIIRSQLFCPSELEAIMTRIGNGGLP